MKKFFCLFERPFKIQKNGVFLFELPFSILEILTFFYYANWISDEVILFVTKNGKILSKQYLSVLETWHHKCASQKKHTFNVIAKATV